MTGHDQIYASMNASSTSYADPYRYLDKTGYKRHVESDPLDEPRAKRKIEQVSARLERINLDRQHSLSPLHAGQSDTDEETMRDPDPIAFIEEPDEDNENQPFGTLQIDPSVKDFFNQNHQDGFGYLLAGRCVRTDAVVPYFGPNRLDDLANGHCPSIQELFPDNDQWHIPSSLSPMVTLPVDDDSDDSLTDEDRFGTSINPLKIVELDGDDGNNCEAMEID